MTAEPHNDAAPVTPAAIFFQRKANRWLRLLRDQVERLRSGDDDSPDNLDYFDILRSHLNISNGAALEALFGVGSTRDERPVGPMTTSIWQRSWLKVKHHAYVQRRRWTRYQLGVPQIRGFSGKRLVLAVPRHLGHMADISPVLNSLRDRHGLAVAVAAIDRGLAQRSVELGLPVVSFYGRRNSRRNHFQQRHKTLLETLERAIDVVATESQEFSREQLQCLADNSRLSLQSLIEDTVETADAVEALLTRANPQLTIIGNPYTYEGRLTVQAARRRKIATLVIEHGSIFPDDPIWEECTVDSVCVWGEPSRNALHSCGVEDRQIVVTGAPRYDAVFAETTDNSLRNNPQTAHILVATSGPGDQVSLDQHRSFIRGLFAAADRHPDIVWQVKLHKKDRPQHYVDSQGRGRPNIRVDSSRGTREGLDIFDQLRAARALVTISSTAALDAMAVKVPVIAYDVWPAGQGLRGVTFLENGSTYSCSDSEGLAQIARRLWDGRRDSEIDASAQDYAAWHFANRGEAAEAVARQALFLMNRSNLCELDRG